MTSCAHKPPKHGYYLPPTPAAKAQLELVSVCLETPRTLRLSRVPESTKLWIESPQPGPTILGVLQARERTSTRSKLRRSQVVVVPHSSGRPSQPQRAATSSRCAPPLVHKVETGSFVGRVCTCALACSSPLSPLPRICTPRVRYSMRRFPRSRQAVTALNMGSCRHSVPSPSSCPDSSTRFVERAQCRTLVKSCSREGPPGLTDRFPLPVAGEGGSPLAQCVASPPPLP